MTTTSGHEAVPVDVRPAADGPRSIADRLRGVLVWENAPLAALALVVLVWAIVMGHLILLRDNRMGAFDFDTGINDQYLWQIAHWRQANTVRGLSFFGNHAYYGLVLFIPLLWLGGTFGTWDVLHTIALASTAFPLFFLARDKLRRPWLAVVAGVVWLAQPSVQWFVQEGFHPENFALPFLVGTYLYGERLIAERKVGALTRHTRWGFVACFLLTIVWKEDLALALLGMGVCWAIKKEWKLARRVMAVSGLYFVVVAVILIPRFAGGSVFGGAYDLGKTPTQIAEHVVEHPSRLAHKLRQNDAVGYGGGLNQGYGFVPLLSPGTLLIGLPQATIDIISASNFTWDLRWHYQSIPMAALAISMVEGIAFLCRRKSRYGMAGLVAVIVVSMWDLRWHVHSFPLTPIAIAMAVAFALLCGQRQWFGDAAVAGVLVASLVCTRWYGPSPVSIKYRQGYWPLTVPVLLPLREEVRHMIPSSDGVSADYLMVPQLTHRQVIYTFPNPWRSSNYGVKPNAVGDPAKVKWVTVEEDLMSRRDLGLLTSIFDSGEFKTVFNVDGVILMERIHPPGHGRAPIVDPYPNPSPP